MKEECLSRLVFLNEAHLRKTISIFIGHYRHRRYHQWMENKLVEPPVSFPKEGHIRCQKQLGGMLNYYHPALQQYQGRLKVGDVARRVTEPLGLLVHKILTQKLQKRSDNRQTFFMCDQLCHFGDRVCHAIQGER